MEQNLMASVRRFCEWQFAANEPAMWEAFHKKYPQFKRSDFANGTNSWRDIHQSDAERMIWYNKVRIKRINVTECINRYLDWRFAAGQSATWDDLHKIFPAAKQGNFKKIISLWRIKHKMDSSALWWFDRIRPGKINAAQCIARYLDWHYAENTPAPWADFSRICDQASKNAYNHGIYSWRDQNKSDLEAMKWFETVLPGKVRGREKVRRYIDWKYAAGDFAKWVDFHKKCPQVAKRVFKDGRREWRKILQHDTQAMEWYQQTVIDKYNGTERVRLYLNWRYAASSIASWDDFHKLCPKVAKNTYNSGKSSWKKNNCENPDITEWLKLGIEKHRNEKNWIVRYFDWQCAADEPANWTDCGKKCSDITKKIFHKAKEEWYRSHLTNPDAIQWYQNTRLTPSLNSRIIKWIDQRYELNESCWYYYFHKQYPNIKYSVFKRGRENWRYIHREDRKFREWMDPFLISKKFASLAGHLFEQYIIAHLQPALREREIVFYYNTTSFAESAKFKGHYDKSAKRVEGRLLISDLIAQNTKIGASLRNFLLSCGRSQLALDITIGHDIGSKIKRYADEITALLVVTPYGVSGQRLIESHIRIISISEFTGPHWLNLDNSTRIAIENTIKECFDAIRGGPVSPEWQRFQANAIYKWASVVDALKAYGSQSEYRMRVVEGVAMALKRGTIPTELKAYAETARAAGHTVYADLMEGLAQTITALARQSIDQRKPMHEPIPKDGGNRGEYQDPIQMVEEHMRYLEGLDREDAKQAEQNPEANQGIDQKNPPDNEQGQAISNTQPVPRATKVETNERRATLEGALQRLRDYPRNHPQSPTDARLPPDIQADIDFLDTAAHEGIPTESVGGVETRDPVQEIEADMEYLENLARGDGPQGEMPTAERHKEGSSQAGDQETFTNTDDAEETPEAAEDDGPEDEDEEDEEDSLDSFF